MTPLPRDLRRSLEELQLLPDGVYASECHGCATAAEAMRRLRARPRCQLHDGPLPLLTEYQQGLLERGRGAELSVTVEGERYVLLQKLGSGGQGDVFLASPTPCGSDPARFVAVKRTNDPDAGLTLVRREVEALRRVQHPNIARLVAADPAQGVIVTRFVDGPSLQRLLNERQRFPVADVVSIGLQLCQALEVLHGAGLIHKDVKPSNVILERDSAILIDFGLTETQAAAGHGGGTAFYMAPEVYFGEPRIDPRADVYSLAATLYCLLVGKPPRFQQGLSPRFQSTRARQDAQRFRVFDAPLECDPGDFRRNLPPRLTEMIVKALSATPDERPGTVEGVAAQLRWFDERMKEIAELEKDLRTLSRVCLELYRASVFERDMFDVRSNAAQLRESLDLLPNETPRLRDFQVMNLHPSGIGEERHIRHRTKKLLLHVDALKRSLDKLADLPNGTASESTFMSAGLDGIRDAGVLAFSLSHEWLNLLEVWGCEPLE